MCISGLGLTSISETNNGLKDQGFPNRVSLHLCLPSMKFYQIFAPKTINNMKRKSIQHIRFSNCRWMNCIAWKMLENQWKLQDISPDNTTLAHNCPSQQNSKQIAKGLQYFYIYLYIVMCYICVCVFVGRILSSLLGASLSIVYLNVLPSTPLFCLLVSWLFTLDNYYYSFHF